jgi:hypothetical protein
MFDRDHAPHEDAKLLSAMFHQLKIHIHNFQDASNIGSAWWISQDKTAAVWDKGFQEFLNASDEHQVVLEQLTFIKSARPLRRATEPGPCGATREGLRSFTHSLRGGIAHKASVIEIASLLGDKTSGQRHTK